MIHVRTGILNRDDMKEIVKMSSTAPIANQAMTVEKITTRSGVELMVEKRELDGQVEVSFLIKNSKTTVLRSMQGVG